MAISFGINYGADLPPQGEIALGIVQKFIILYTKVMCCMYDCKDHIDGSTNNRSGLSLFKK